MELADVCLFQDLGSRDTSFLRDCDVTIYWEDETIYCGGMRLFIEGDENV